MAAFHAICDTAALFNARPVADPGEVAALYKQFINIMQWRVNQKVVFRRLRRAQTSWQPIHSLVSPGIFPGYFLINLFNFRLLRHPLFGGGGLHNKKGLRKNPQPLSFNT